MAITLLPPRQTAPLYTRPTQPETSLVQPSVQLAPQVGPLSKWAIVQKVSVTVLSSIPAALVALPAAYGSAQFSQSVYEPPWNAAIGIGIEGCYIGLILFAQKKSRRAFLMTALSALVCSIIYNTLHAAEVKGLLKEQAWFIEWGLSFLHGTPLPLLGFSYFMLLHSSSDEIAPPLQPQAYFSEGPVPALAAPTERSSSAISASTVLPTIAPGAVVARHVAKKESQFEDQRVEVENPPLQQDMTASVTQPAAPPAILSPRANSEDKEKPTVSLNSSRVAQAVANGATKANQDALPVSSLPTPNPATFEETSLSQFVTLVGSLARQVQSGKLGVVAFEGKIEEWLNEYSPKLDEQIRALISEELKKRIRQVQKRELKVREFDQSLTDFITRLELSHSLEKTGTEVSSVMDIEQGEVATV
jgi:hypothetical protein